MPQPTQGLTLEKAISLAEQQHPDLAEAEALIDAAAARARNAGRFPDPEAVMRMESAPFNGRTTGEAEYLAGLVQPIPLSRRLSKDLRAGELERLHRMEKLRVRRRELRKQVHAAFATGLYQERAFLNQAEFVRSLEKSVAITKARIAAGDALPEDLARVELEVVRARVDLTRSVSLRDQALLALTAAIGDPALSIKTLEGELESALEIPTLESLATHLASHPALELANSEVELQQARIDLAEAGRVPDLNVELLYRRMEAEDRNAFDVGLSIPLPIFSRNRAEAVAARAELQASQARQRSTRHQINLELREVHAELTTALASSHSLKTQVLPRVDTVLQSAEARYQAGEISLSEVLPVRRDRATVQMTYLESLRDVMQAWAAVTVFVGP